MINKLKNICMIIVLGIVGYGICFNISHAISLHQTITYDFDKEAMKMENETFSPATGTVVGVHVKKGDAVNSDDLLISIG